MKILSDEKIDNLRIDHQNKHLGFDNYLRAITEAQHEDTLRQVRELLDGIENPYDDAMQYKLCEFTAFEKAIRTMKALLEE